MARRGEAGFARTEGGASVSSQGTLEATRRMAVSLHIGLRGLGPTALAQGWMAQSEVEAVAAEIDAWAERPDAPVRESFDSHGSSVDGSGQECFVTGIPFAG